MKILERVTLIPTTHSLHVFGSVKNYRPSQQDKVETIRMLISVIISAAASKVDDEEKWQWMTMDGSTAYSFCKLYVEDNPGTKLPPKVFFDHVFASVYKAILEDFDTVGFKPHQANYFNEVQSPVFLSIAPKNWIGLSILVLKQKSTLIPLLTPLERQGRNYVIRTLKRTFRREFFLNLESLRKEISTIEKPSQIARLFAKQLMRD